MVVVWPAMGTPARYYRHLAGALGAAGARPWSSPTCAVRAAAPRRRRGAAGTGTPSSPTTWRPCWTPSSRAWTAGRSTCSATRWAARRACCTWPAPAARGSAGLILVAVGLPWFRTYGRRAFSTLVLTQWIVAVTAVLRVWPGWGFGGRQARGVIRDWGYTARHGRFPRLRGVDVEAGLASVRTPVLAISVSADQYTPAATTDHLCAKLTAAPVAAGAPHRGLARPLHLGPHAGGRRRPGCGIRPVHPAPGAG